MMRVDFGETVEFVDKMIVKCQARITSHIKTKSPWSMLGNLMQRGDGLNQVFLIELRRMIKRSTIH